MDKFKLEKGFWKNNDLKPSTKCVSCEEKFRDIVKEYGRYAVEDGSYSEKLGGWICHPCRESQDDHPNGTVLIYTPKEGIVEKYIVTDYEDQYGSRNVEDGELEDLDFDVCDYADSPIQFKYVHTDAWRGYHEPVGEGWKVLHSDCILSGSEDEQELKKFDNDTKKVLWDLGYEFAVAYGTTSNLFSCGYDILIKTEQEQGIVRQIALYSQLAQLVAKYRDSGRFNRTALIGSGEKTWQSDLLVKAAQKLKDGEDFETVKEKILQEAKETA